MIVIRGAKKEGMTVEDRLSSLPDELIHKILFCYDMKFAVQTCLLSSRWKLVWTSLPCLNFSSRQFHILHKFAKFVTHVLSHRNHQIEVSTVKLRFHAGVNQDFVRKIAEYAFSHNVQQLTVFGPSSCRHVYPSCLFSSQSLKHFTFTCISYTRLLIATEAPLDFPSLTTLNLCNIILSSDVFSKCVNLKNLTLEDFCVMDMEVFDIITPQLSNLKLIDGRCSNSINVIAPQLENLTVINCSIGYLNAPPRLLSFCYTFQLWPCRLVQFSNDQFPSLNKVTIYLSKSKDYPTVLYKEEDARMIINMLQHIHSVKYLTLDADTIECISSFPDLLSQHSSPFSNLVCLTIDYSKKKDALIVTMSSEARNFFLENSPSTTFTMKLPKVHTLIRIIYSSLPCS
uniref:F-box domain-containing protein n=1 Tax=Lactuca sativa TaxID=4236 RepID=A0A9R1XMA1_LACSA|nr:hypothetical protein LSAT_V11C300111620 [Lactuca sativa]